MIHWDSLAVHNSAIDFTVCLWRVPAFHTKSVSAGSAPKAVLGWGYRQRCFSSQLGEWGFQSLGPRSKDKPATIAGSGATWSSLLWEGGEVCPVGSCLGPGADDPTCRGLLGPWQGDTPRHLWPRMLLRMWSYCRCLTRAVDLGGFESGLALQQGVSWRFAALVGCQ